MGLLCSRKEMEIPGPVMLWSTPGTWAPLAHSVLWVLVPSMSSWVFLGRSFSREYLIFALGCGRKLVMTWKYPAGCCRSLSVV